MDERTDLPFVSLSRSQTQIFEQLSDEEFWHYAREAANPRSALQCPAEEYLVCKLGTRHCMFPVAIVREVAPPHQRTILPGTPHWVAGLTTWRGEIFAEIDLEAYLWSGVEHPKRRTSSGHRQQSADLLLVIQAQGIILGLLVTAVNTVVHFDAEHIVPFELAPDWCSVLSPRAIRGIQDDVLVLNIPAIFDDIVDQIKEQPLS